MSPEKSAGKQCIVCHSFSGGGPYIPQSEADMPMEWQVRYMRFALEACSCGQFKQTKGFMEWCVRNVATVLEEMR